jgi:DNA polymerase-3 subunit epsilon
MDEAAIMVHRLRRQDLRGGLSAGEAIDRTLEFVGNRPILGYHVRFDIAVLDRQLQALHGFGLPNRAVELANLYVERWGRPDDGIEGDLRLETIARRLDMPVPKGRHTAYRDALFVATLYVRLMHGERRR